MRIHQIAGILIIGAVIVGCAGTEVRQNKPASASVVEIIDQQTLASSAINDIVDEFTQTQNEQKLQQSLIALASAYQAQKNCTSSDIVVKYSLPILSSDEFLAKANILRSECAIFQIENNQSILVEADSRLTLPNILSRELSEWLSTNDTAGLDASWAGRQKMTIAYLQSLQGNYANALSTALSADSEKSILNEFIPKLSFDWLGRLSYQERIAVIEKHPSLFMYQRLFSIIEDASITDSQRQQQIISLIESAKATNEFNRLPDQVSRFLLLNFNQQQQIGVMLPLSGRLASQGEAIKQGMLASYYEQLMGASSLSADNARAANTLTGNTVIDSSSQPRSKLVFIDTGSENELPSTVNIESLQQYSTIIGPLLKSHIEATQGMLSEQVLRIHLNQLDANTLSFPPAELESSNDDLGLSNTVTASTDLSLIHFFALSPEQEAQELASQMHAQNIRHPVLIHDESAVTKRMADAFLDTWNNQQKGGTTIAPSEVKYTDNKSMRAGITSALDVLQSQQRINQLSNLVDETVHSVTRNRRDVDAFVVFARPNEVELINPIIESSMSLFSGQQIPVFATSYSYNHKQNKNSLRDLRNLVFVDMPFVMPDSRQGALAQEVDTLFNQPSTTYLRLFAFGYDAVRLTEHVMKLRIFNQVSLPGLTGMLSIESNGNVSRKLETLEINTGS